MIRISNLKIFFQNHLKRLTIQIAVLAIIFGICCWALLVIADMVFEDKNLQFDENIFATIQPYYTAVNTRIMNFFTFFGSQNFLLPANILLVSIFFFYKKIRRYSLRIASVSITSTAVLFLLKAILHRSRPLVPLISKAHGYSFPSGHTFTSFVFFGMLAFIMYKTIKTGWVKWILIVLLFSFTLMVGFSRVYLKLHYASDVIAGFCLGIIWLLLAKWILIKPAQEKVMNPHD